MSSVNKISNRLLESECLNLKVKLCINYVLYTYLRLLDDESATVYLLNAMSIKIFSVEKTLNFPFKIENL